jgi:glycosyltransferase involved in cell wall biosynthesis
LKFSVLLPTRNRLDLLKEAIETVRLQDYDEWEIVVSDNASTENIAAYVGSLQDERIRYVRSESFIPVTDNWNLALKHATGDYVLMLGDDDGLVRGYFRNLEKILRAWELPELVFHDAFQFAHPGTIPNRETGFVQFAHVSFFARRREPFLLGRKEALEVVHDAIAFRVTYPYNMQYSLVSRKLIERLSRDGSFYDSPYPDYYATNALLLAADRILAVPQPWTIIGISKKSFGFFYFNKREKEGTQLLSNLDVKGLPESVRASLLPGSDMNTCWLLAMQTLQERHGRLLHSRVDVLRYRRLQLMQMYLDGGLKAIFRQWPKLWWYEKLMIGMIAIPTLVCLELVSTKLKDRVVAKFMFLSSPYPKVDTRNRAVDYRCTLDAFHDLKPEYYE